MSVIFSIDDKIVWSSASRVAVLYVDMLEATGRFLGLPSGIRDTNEDEYQINPAALAVLVEHMLKQEHTIADAITGPTVAVALAMLDRAGRETPSCSDPDIERLRTELKSFMPQ